MNEAINELQRTPALAFGNDDVKKGSRGACGVLLVLHTDL